MSDLGPMETRLRAFLNGRDTAAAGAVQVINLDKVRNQLGSSWDRMANKARSIVQSVVDRHLGPNDLGMPLSDLAYVIVFGGLNVAEAEIRVLLIAAEITRRLLGEQANPHDFTQVTVVPLDGTTQRPADIIDAFGRLATSQDKLAASDAASGESELQWKSFHHLGAAADTESSAPAPAPSAEAAVSKPRWKAFGETVELPAGLEFHYRPIWNVSRKVLSTYACVSSLMGRGGALDIETLLESEDSRLTPDLDLFMLARVVGDLTRLHAKGTRVLMACPLHVATLAMRRTRERFVRAYHPLPEAIRRDIIFELIGSWHGMPQSRMVELLAYIKPVSRSVTARLELDWTRFDLLRDGGITVVSINLLGRTDREAKLLPQMETFAERANRVGIRTCAHGLSTSSLAVAALGAGFDLIEGNAIHGPVNTPEHIFRFNISTLFADLLAGIRRSQ